jgi:hypothetical protein
MLEQLIWSRPLGTNRGLFLVGAKINKYNFHIFHLYNYEIIKCSTIPVPGMQIFINIFTGTLNALLRLEKYSFFFGITSVFSSTEVQDYR